MAYSFNRHNNEPSKPSHKKKAVSTRATVFYLSLATILSFVLVFVFISKKLSQSEAIAKQIVVELNSTPTPEPDSFWSYVPPIEITASPVPTKSPNMTPAPTAKPNYTYSPSNTLIPSYTSDPTSKPSLVTMPDITKAPVPVVTNAPAPAITDAPVPVITDAPAPIITEAPAPVITDAPTAVPEPTTLPLPPGNHYEYYKTSLPESIQDDYNTLVAGLYAHSNEITVSKSSYLNELFHAATFDHPELFWVNPSASSSYYKSSPTMNIKPSYAFDASSCVPCQNNIDSVAQYLISSTSGQSTYNKIKATYEYLIRSSYYEQCAYDQTCYPIFMENRGVCMSYAAAFKLLMDRMEIPCIIVTNTTHAWNMVCLNGVWYHVDVTFGDPVTSSGRQMIDYSYLLISDSEILQDHAFSSTYPQPAAPSNCPEKASDKLKNGYT